MLVTLLWCCSSEKVGSGRSQRLNADSTSVSYCAFQLRFSVDDNILTPIFIVEIQLEECNYKDGSLHSLETLCFNFCFLFHIEGCRDQQKTFQSISKCTMAARWETTRFLLWTGLQERSLAFWKKRYCDYYLIYQQIPIWLWESFISVLNTVVEAFRFQSISERSSPKVS